MIISGVKAYFKVAWALKTPFVFLMDTKYKILSPMEALDVFAEKLRHIKYSPFHDCNAYAWVAKALAYEDRINSFGFVIGLWNMRFHSWNCVVTPQDVFQLEPQQERMFKKDRRYWAWMVIL